MSGVDDAYAKRLKSDERVKAAQADAAYQHRLNVFNDLRTAVVKQIQKGKATGYKLVKHNGKEVPGWYLYRYYEQCKEVYLLTDGTLVEVETKTFETPKVTNKFSLNQKTAGLVMLKSMGYALWVNAKEYFGIKKTKPEWDKEFQHKMIF